MSNTKKRPVHVVAPIATKLRDSLEPFCQRICIAGSLRRYDREEHRMVGDIELVAIPNITEQYDLFGRRVRTDNHLLTTLDGLIAMEKIFHNEPRRWGDRLRSFVLRTTKLGEVYKVDLFLCEPETWGSTLLMRTGSQGFSKWMVTLRSQGGAMPAGMNHDKNRLWQWADDGKAEAIPVPEEEDFFRAVGMPFVPVEDRDDRRWLKYKAWT